MGTIRNRCYDTFKVTDCFIVSKTFKAILPKHKKSACHSQFHHTDTDQLYSENSPMVGLVGDVNMPQRQLRNFPSGL